jgi:toxin ParE1/3/4
VSRYRLARLAQTDLAEIREYVARDKPNAARRLIASFFEYFHLLARSPDLGENRPDLREGLRVFSVRNYVIVYRRADSGIEIVRVLSGYRDWEALF